MCVNSRAINKITIKYRFPILRLDDMLDMIFCATIFSKINLKWLSPNSLVWEMNGRPLSRRKMDNMKLVVMPFELTNAPSTFM